jgi:RNA polymerase sigma-70 factor (ECF subfamily)
MPVEIGHPLSAGLPTEQEQPMAEDGATSLSLLDRIRNGDPVGWQRIIDLYSPLILSWCRRHGVEGADAEDILQEVFKAVTGGIASFRRDRPEDSFRGWLRGITRHKLQAYWRTRSTQLEAIGGTNAWQRLQEISGPEPNEAEDGEEREQCSALFHRALKLVQAEFEPRTWQAFWRVTVDGQPSSAVAAEFGMTPTAVRMIKSRVLRRLREELGDLID